MFFHPLPYTNDKDVRMRFWKVSNQNVQLLAGTKNPSSGGRRSLVWFINSVKLPTTYTHLRMIRVLNSAGLFKSSMRIVFIVLKINKIFFALFRAWGKQRGRET